MLVRLLTAVLGVIVLCAVAASTTAQQTQRTFLPVVLQRGPFLVDQCAGTPTPSPTPAEGSIAITVTSPAHCALVGDTLTVVVAVSSVYQIQRVQATVEGRVVSLSPTGSREWRGTVSLAEVGRGERFVEVTATDALGATGRGVRWFVHDRPPVVAIAAPAPDTVARPHVRVTASCSDDDPGRCASIIAVVLQSEVCAPGVAASLSPVNGPVATGVSSIDAVADVGAFNGYAVTLCVLGRDSAGQETAQGRRVYVETSSRLRTVLTVPGTIWDTSAERVLYLDTSTGRNVLKLRERATGQDATVRDDPVRQPLYGYVTPRGAIFLEQGGTQPMEVLEWRDGVLAVLGRAVWLRVEGGFAVFGHPALTLRDLTAGTNTALPNEGYEPDVGPNGDVVYVRHGADGSRQLELFRAGSTTLLATGQGSTTTAGGPNDIQRPETDGVNVVFLRVDTSCCFHGGTDRVVLYRPEGEVTLASIRYDPLQGGRTRPDVPFMIAGGWVAFQRPSPTGELQVWLRSPGGEEKQVSLFSGSSTLEALTENGEVVFRSGDRRYLGGPSSTPVELSTTLGRASRVDGRLHVVIAGTLLQVVP